VSELRSDSTEAAIAPIASQSADWTILVVDDEPGIAYRVRAEIGKATLRDGLVFFRNSCLAII
jgi:hypothetical protein